MKNPRFLTIFAGTVALLLAVAPVSAQTLQSDQIHKLDRQLRESLTKMPKPERVIIRTRDGQRAALRLALEAHGDVVTGDHPEVGALSAVVHGEDLLAIANDPAVESVSIDAEVRADGVSKVKAVRNLKQAVEVAEKRALREDRKATRVARQAAARTGRRAKAQAARAARVAEPTPIQTGELRKLQGLDGYAPTGGGVGVAIIDSGIEPDANDLLITSRPSWTSRTPTPSTRAPTMTTATARSSRA